MSLSCPWRKIVVRGVLFGLVLAPAGPGAWAQDAGAPPSAEDLVESGPDTGLADTLADLGLVYYRQGKFEKAASAYRRAWEARKRRFGATHPKTLTVMNGLAGSLASQGKTEEAESVYEKLLAAYEESSLEAGAVHQNLAVVLTRDGRYQEAAGHYQAALKIREARLEAAHPAVLASVGGLAGVQAARGEWEAAEKLYRRLLAARRQREGERAVAVADVLQNLGTVLSRRGKHEAAAEHFEEAVAIRREQAESQEREAPDGRLMAALRGAASARAGAGAWEKSLEIYDELLAMQEEALGEEHVAVAGTQYGRALALGRLGRAEEAEAAFRQALSIRKRELGDAHPQTQATVLALGQVLLATEQVQEARTLFEELLAAQEKALGPDTPRLAPTLRRLGQIYSSQGELDRATTALERAARLQEKGEDS